MVLEKTLESPLDCKEIQPVHPKRNRSWIFIVRTDVEAEAPILWPTDAKSWLIWKDPDAGKIEGGRRRGWQRIGWLDGITNSMGMSLSKLGSWWRTGKPGVLQSTGSQRVRHDWAIELNWAELIGNPMAALQSLVYHMSTTEIQCQLVNIDSPQWCIPQLISYQANYLIKHISLYTAHKTMLFFFFLVKSLLQAPEPSWPR